jgi:hypothetical protein|tara:strand:+ start:416 stop:685 length:270 start_codon:yes stop_codon:yes gene_type:complete
MTNERTALAAQLLDNPVWAEAFDMLKSAYTAKLMALGPTHDIERYKFCEALRQIEMVKTHVERTFEAGSLAVDEIEETKPSKVFAIRGF